MRKLSSMALASTVLVVLGLLLLPPAATHVFPSDEQQCGPNPSIHVLNRPGGIPADTTQGITSYSPFFVALADFAYAHDFVFSAVGMSPRKPVGPCLKAWGAAEDPTHLVSTNSKGADTHAYVFRSEYDIIVTFRGLTDLNDITGVMSQSDPVNIVSGSTQQPIIRSTARHMQYLLNGTISPEDLAATPADRSEDVWVVEGYALAFVAMAPKLLREIQAQVTKLPPAQRAKYNVWITGHSDGGMHAQLAAIWLAGQLGVQHIGGLVLFAPSRIGSAGFTRVYNAVLGNKTLHFTYGRDPAREEMFEIQDDLRYAGLGIVACPNPDKVIEDLVIFPVGEDTMNACTNLQRAHWVTPASTLVGGLASKILNREWTQLAVDSVQSLQYLAHHLPNMAFDAIMRQLSVEQNPSKAMTSCQLKALRLPQCVISHKCDTALRPEYSPQCHSCGSDKACQEYFGQEGAVCDNRLNGPVASSWLCYKHAPPTIVGLLTLPNGQK